ncbi:MAG TPA: hybrid sensor histidine kinase/response regulator, partial [Rheinheimera sp.]|nr:hybrid sensor histidine kinase/response regulator [Rheinheimera sp.]
MKLRETLVAYMLPLLVLPVLAFGYLAYEFSQRYLTQQAYSQAERSLATQQVLLSSFLQQQQTRLSMLAQSPLLLNHIEQPAPESLNTLHQQFKQFVSEDRRIMSLKLINLNGEYETQLPERDDLSSVPNRFRNEYFSSLQAQVNRASYFMAEDSDSKNLQLFFAHKLYSGTLSESKRLWGYL